jgi:hypothetical protein
LFALRELSNRDKHRRLNLLRRTAEVDFVDAHGKPIYEGPAVHAGIAESYEGDTYTARLTVQEKLDVDVYLLPAYHVRLDEPPKLFGDLIDTLAGINDFIDRWVLPTIRGLLDPAH